MPRLSDCKPRDVLRVLRRHGFDEVRRSGGHAILKKPNHRFLVSVPVHDTVKKGTLAQIIRTAGLTTEQFLADISPPSGHSP